MFEENICVDLAGVLDGKLNYANVPLLEFFVRPCVDRPEVLDEGSDYAIAFLSEFFVKVRCPPVF